jgi:anti-sigma B factor antagonist
MSITHQELKDGAWLVEVSDRLDQSQTPQLESVLNSLLDEGHSRIIVDLSQVTYVNSGGLRCLVTAWRNARSQGGDVFLTGLRARVQEVFTMVGFDKIFEVYPSRKSAQQAWLENE